MDALLATMKAADPASAQAARWRSLAKGGAVNLVGAAVAAVANIALVVQVTRGTDSARAGGLFAATSIFLIATTVGRLGTTTGLVYWVARLRALGRVADVRRCVRIGLGPVALVSLAAAGLLLLVAGPLGRLVGGAQHTQVVGYLQAFALFVPAAALADACMSATRGLGNMRVTVLVDKMGRPLLQMAGVGLVLLVTSGTPWLAVGWGAPYVVAAAGSALWLRVLLRRVRPAPAVFSAEGLPAEALPAEALSAQTLPPGPASPSLFREFWRFTLPRALSTLVQLALQRLDIVLIAALRGPSQAAVYTAATRFLVVGQLGSQAVSTAIAPRLSGLLAVGDRQGAGRVYQVATGWVVLATWPLYLACVAFPRELVAIFGRGYGEGSPVVVVLALTMLIATASGMVDTMLNMAGRTSWTLYNSSSALATMIVADVALVPRYGVAGAAVGWSLAILVNNLVPLLQLLRGYHLHPFGPETRLAVALSAFCGGPAVALTAFGATRELRALALVAGLLVLAAAVWRGRRELQLDALVSRRRRRASSGPVDPPMQPVGNAGRGRGMS